MKKLNNTGFGAIEALLSVIAIALVVFVGYYVYHSNQVATKTYNTASNIAQSHPTKQTASTKAKTAPSQKYVTIKEWGIKAPYSGSLNLTYTINTTGFKSGDGMAVFSSSQLTALDPTCAGHGGGITRYAAGDDASASGDGTNPITAEARAAASSPATYAHIGNYYYFFAHEQSACGSDPTKTETVQQQTNNDVSSMTELFVAE